MGTLYKQLLKPDAIWRAWSVVLENGRHSRSSRTRAEILEFGVNAPKNIRSIVGKLRRRTFRFEAATGVAIPKKNKSAKRPVVLAPVPNRIVQRAILDVVQSIPSIDTKLKAGGNFGGIEGLGVPAAVREAYKASRQSKFYIRTDIKAFFDKVPRDKAIEKITSETKDPEFDALLRIATITELSNLAQLGRDGELFPLEDIGVAQGSALSPLLCNLLLAELDGQLDGRGIRCIRYIDDFILFAPSRAKATSALRSAQKTLQALNLECYDPDDRPDKAAQGQTTEQVDFLGCEIWPDRVRASRQSRRRLLERVRDVMSTGLSASGDPSAAARDRKTYVDSLVTIGNVIRGWGNTYSFCTDDRLMADVDVQIDLLLQDFRDRYQLALNRHSKNDRRRLIGIFLLADCIKDLEMRALVSELAPPKAPVDRNRVRRASQR